MSESITESVAEIQELTVENNEYVKMSVDSGVAPLQLRFFPIIEADSGTPLAYRTETVIHSVMLGVLPEDKYTHVTDNRVCGEELFRHTLQHMITAYRAFKKAERKIDFISIRCYPELISRIDLYELAAAVIQKNPSLDPQRLCFEFPASLMMQNTELVHKAILDLKLLKIRSAVIGCGTKDFPISKLVDVEPDIVFLDPAATAWAGSRNKPQLFPSLVSYIKSMGIDVYAEGEDSMRKMMRGSDCSGFIVKDSKGLTFEEALAQKEEEV